MDPAHLPVCKHPRACRCDPPRDRQGMTIDYDTLDNKKIEELVVSKVLKYTMTGPARLRATAYLTKVALKTVHGDIVETGAACRILVVHLYVGVIICVFVC